MPNINGDQVAVKMNNSISTYLMTGELSVNTVYTFEGILSKSNYIQEIQQVLDKKLKK